MNSARSLLPVVRACSRQFSKSAVPSNEVVSEQFSKLKIKQKKFQTEDGIPVYLKGGVFDKILFQATVLGTTVGVIMGIQVFATLALKS